MASQRRERTQIFISYSHKDAKWLARLRVHLRPLEREYRVEVWDDTRISPGSTWKEEIKKAVESAKVAILLISADFLASDFIATDELPPLLKAAKEEGATILPIIISPSRFLQNSRLTQFQAANDPSEPLVEMREGQQEAVFVKVAVAIETLLSKTPGETQEGRTGSNSNTQVLQTGSKNRPSTVVQPKRHWKKSLIVVASALLAIIMAFTYFFYWLPRDRIAANSIAVLPFVEDNPNPEYEYLSEGLTESLINDLSKFSNIRVVARTSVFRLKGQEFDPRKIGKELNAQVLLMGRISRQDDTVRVSFELMDVRNNRHLGGGLYSSKESDHLLLQRKLSQEVFETLHLKLKGFERRQGASKYTDNSEAYRLYLLGRFFWNKRTEEGFRKSIVYFRQAIEKDSHFAQSFAGLADAYFILGQWSADPLKKATQNARDAVMRALELNENSAEAHISLGDIKMLYDYDWQSARVEYERAIEIDPDNAYAHSNYAVYLSFTGEHDAAFSEIVRAQQLDPLSIYINATVAQVLFHARKYDPAIEQSRRVLEIGEAIGPHLMLGWSYEQKGMYVEAIGEFQKYNQLAGDPETLDVLGHAYARAGDERKARALLDEMLKAKDNGAIIDPSAFALIYPGLGEKDAAFDWLNKAYEYRSPNLTLIKTHPYFDPYRSEPRFIDLLNRVGFS